MTKTLTTAAIVAMSGSALAQSSLDIDRAYAAELRADADTRSSLLGQTGPDIGVDIFTQFRYTYGTREGLTPAADAALGDADTTLGFSTPRTQVRLHGAVPGTDITGHVDFDFGGAFDHGASGGNGGAAGPGNIGDGDATLRNAYGHWAIDDNWSLQFGQLRNPLIYESNVEPEYSQGVERSFVHSVLDVGYTQGVAFNYTDDMFKFTGVISDGPANVPGGTLASNSGINAGGESDLSLTGRFDLLLSGNWDQFKDFASFRGSNTAFRVGGGVHYSTRGETNLGGGSSILVPAGGTLDTEDIFVWTVDAQYEGDGWGVFASYTSTEIDTDFIVGGSPGSLDATTDGLILQGNMFLSDQVEAYGRYSILFLEDDPAVGIVPVGAEDQYSTLVAGLNYYLVPESHAARFSIDLAWAIDDSSGIDGYLGGAGDAATTGFLQGSGAGGGNADADEVLVRAQMSLLF